MSILNEKSFADYVIAETDNILLRKRHYICFLPVATIFYFFTLGKLDVSLVYKEEYFIKPLSDIKNEIPPKKLSRKEYLNIRNEQRRIYKSQNVSDEWMNSAYTTKSIGYLRSQ